MVVFRKLFSLNALSFLQFFALNALQTLLSRKQKLQQIFLEFHAAKAIIRQSTKATTPKGKSAKKKAPGDDEISSSPGAFYPNYLGEKGKMPQHHPPLPGFFGCHRICGLTPTSLHDLRTFKFFGRFSKINFGESPKKIGSYAIVFCFYGGSISRKIWIFWALPRCRLLLYGGSLSRKILNFSGSHASVFCFYGGSISRIFLNFSGSHPSVFCFFTEVASQEKFIIFLALTPVSWAFKGGSFSIN